LEAGVVRRKKRLGGVMVESCEAGPDSAGESRVSSDHGPVGDGAESMR
jgi:hypothetical protein